MMIDWFIDWIRFNTFVVLVGWLAAELFDWSDFTYLVYWLIDSLTGWVTECLTNWRPHWPTDRPTDKLKDSWLTTDWFFASLSHVRLIYLNLVGSLFIFSLELQLEKELELSAMESQTQRWQQWRTTPLFVQQIRILILLPELDIMFKTSIEIDAIIQTFYPQDCRLHSPFFLL